MAEGNNETSDIARVAEYTQWHQRITSVLLLAQDEQTTHHDTENDQTDDFWRRPGEDHAAKVKAKKQHESQSENTQTAQEVDCHDAFDHLCSGVVNVEEEEEQEKGCSRDGKVDPETP